MNAFVPPNYERLQRGLVAVGAIGLAACAVAALVDASQFLRSYLLGYLIWWGISIGCLGLVMLCNLVGGRWSAGSRVLFEAGAATLPLTLLLFTPIALPLAAVWLAPDETAASDSTSIGRVREAVGELYPWARGPHAESAHEPTFKQAWLNPGFVLGRAAGYFLFWLLLMACVLRWSPIRHADGRQRASANLARASAAGLVGLILTASFAAMDWAMSLEPEWYSTIYGGLIVMGGALAAFALVTATAAWLSDSPRLAERIDPQVLNDLGNLLLAFLMIWAYFAFSQFLIIWSANLPGEAVWYVQRSEGGWQAVAVSIVVLHFIVPFLMLLSRDRKRSGPNLIAVALLILVMHVVDRFWTISPTFYREGLFVHWADVAAVAGIVGAGAAVFLWQVKRRLGILLDAAA